MVKRILQINRADNVGVVLQSITPDDEIEFSGKKLRIKENIPTGHKLALVDIPRGDRVIKYGSSIGEAITDIPAGSWVHTHNLKTGLKEREEYNYQPVFREEIIKEEIIGLEKMPDKIPEFCGYPRKDGQVGIRNEIWIIPTVGCINKVAERLAILAEEKYLALLNEGLLDGIHAFTHPYGCSQLGDDLENTQKILAGLVKHPNAAGVLVLGLGCENNVLEDFQAFIGDHDQERVRFLRLQDVGDEIERGLKELAALVDYAKGFRQETLPVSELKLGLKCGGSDAFSGITANPLLGEISNKLVSLGGTVVLTEVPEMFGAEQILMNRARDQGVFTDIVSLINGFKDYYVSNKQPVYENPSPGNKEGGITTLEEKSLGCTQKGGHVPVNGVKFYGDQVQGKGLYLLESPGNDLVSTTALTAAGVHLILFTTGRGTPFSGPVPTVKVSTNTALSEQKKNWIDFNAGKLLEGKGMGELSAEFFAYIIEVASKNILTKNEQNNYREIAIFKKGVTL